MAHRLAGHAQPTAAVLVASAGLLALSCGETPPPVPATISLAVVNARIWTGNPSIPWAEALAVVDGRIVATGSSDAIRLLASEENIVDARRRLVLPGFIDSYTQVLDLDAVPGRLPLGGIRSRRQLVTSVRTATATRPNDDWIRGHDWDQRLWGGTLPDRAWIDPVTPDHPVWLKHRDKQVGLANSVALSRARIVAGLRGADRGPDETLTGILSGPAMRQLEASLPTMSTAGVDRALDAALTEAATRGITSAYHVGEWDDLDLFLRARSEGRLTVRIYAAVPLGEWLRLDRAIGVGTFGGDDGR
ncbi:MAG: amidohydrolase family protein, partial [bacterium]